MLADQCLHALTRLRHAGLKTGNNGRVTRASDAHICRYRLHGHVGTISGTFAIQKHAAPLRGLKLLPFNLWIITLVNMSLEYALEVALAVHDCLNGPGSIAELALVQRSPIHRGHVSGAKLVALGMVVVIVVTATTAVPCTSIAATVSATASISATFTNTATAKTSAAASVAAATPPSTGIRGHDVALTESHAPVQNRLKFTNPVLGCLKIFTGCLAILDENNNRIKTVILDPFYKKIDLVPLRDVLVPVLVV